MRVLQHEELVDSTTIQRRLVEVEDSLLHRDSIVPKIVDLKDSLPQVDTTHVVQPFLDDSTSIFHIADTVYHADTSTVVRQEVVVETKEPPAVVLAEPKPVVVVAPDTARNVVMPSDSLLVDTVSAMPPPLVEEIVPPVEVIGMAGKLITPSLRRSDLVVSVLLVSLLLVLILFLRRWPRVVSQMKSVYTVGPKTHDALVDSPESFLAKSALFVVVLFLHGLCLFAFKSHFSELALTPDRILNLSYWALGGATLYLVGQSLLYRFVHWVFFDKIKRKRWNGTFLTLLLLQATLLFPLVMALVYGNLTTTELLISLSAVILMVEITLAICSFRNFFVNFYGILQFIVYFCSLKLASILLLWQIWVLSNNW